MARKKKTPETNGSDDESAPRVDPDEATRNYNVAEIKATIQAGFNNLSELDDLIEAAIERHVKPLKDKRTQTWRNLKADSGIARQMLTPDYKKYRIALAQGDNEETGAQNLDDMRIVAEAMREEFARLGIGEQLDGLKLMEGKDDPDGLYDTKPDADDGAEAEPAEAA